MAVASKPPIKIGSFRSPSLTRTKREVLPPDSAAKMPSICTSIRSPMFPGSRDGALLSIGKNFGGSLRLSAPSSSGRSSGINLRYLQVRAMSAEPCCSLPENLADLAPHSKLHFHLKLVQIKALKAEAHK